MPGRLGSNPAQPPRRSGAVLTKSPSSSVMCLLCPELGTEMMQCHRERTGQKSLVLEGGPAMSGCCVLWAGSKLGRGAWVQSEKDVGDRAYHG